MKLTIARLASNVIDFAGEIGAEAEALGNDPGIPGCEAVLHLRDALRSLNAAREALRAAIAITGDDPLAMIP